MCRVLQVARSGFYQWVQKPLSDRALEDERLLLLIRDSYTASGKVYGSPRVFGDLREAGEQCGKHRVARLMRAHQIKAIRGYKTPRRIAGKAIHRVTQPLEPGVHSSGTRSGLGNGHHLHSHLAGLAVLGGGS